MEIIVEGQIVVPDMGAHWSDPMAAAHELAEEIENTWLRDLKPLADQGHQLFIDVLFEYDEPDIREPSNVACESDPLRLQAISLMTSVEQIQNRFYEKKAGPR